MEKTVPKLHEHYHFVILRERSEEFEYIDFVFTDSSFHSE